MQTTGRIVLASALLIAVFCGAAQAATTFDYKIIDPSPIRTVWAKGHGDYDGDGHIDFMLAGQGIVIWYENPAGMGDSGWIRHVAYSGSNVGFEGSDSGDIDNDGDIDIIIGGYYTHLVYCLENPGKGQDIWKLHILGGPKTDSTHLYDFNHDGKLDIVTRASALWSGSVGSAIYIWKQGKDPFDPAEWTRYRREAGTGEHYNIGDVDDDGRMDIVIANKWLRNTGTINVAKWTEHIFTNAWTHTCAYPFVADIDKDGRNDIVLTPTEKQKQIYKTAWYKAGPDPTKGGWTEHIIEDNIECVTHSLGVYDFDHDGTLDVFTAEMEQSADPDELRIYFNNGDGTNWTKKVIATTGSHWNHFIDVDTDGDIDIFGANHGSKGQPKAELWVNKTNPVIALDKFRCIRVDDKRELPRCFGVAAGDVTGDGKSDIVAGRYFYKNPGGDMTGRWQRTTLSGDPDIDAMLIMDVDGDEYGDVIGEWLPGVYWLEALDTKAEAWTIRAKIGQLQTGPHSHSAQGYTSAQIVPGSKPEIVLSSRGVFYFEIPENPEKDDWPCKRITKSPNSEEGIGAGDIDKDGDIDVCGCINSDAVPNPVGWYENPGNGSEDWTYYQVGTLARWADRFYMADLNRDGRTDIVISAANGDEDGVYWFEAPKNPKAPNWKKHTVIVQPLCNSMDIADMDTDGDIDIIVGQHITSRVETPKKLQIFENDGSGNFTERLIYTGVESHLGARVFNLDGDADLDIVNIGYKEWQYLYIWRNDGVGSAIRKPSELTVTSETSNSAEKQFLLVDQVVEHDGSRQLWDDWDFVLSMPLQPDVPKNWTTPVNYADGRYHLKIEVISMKPTAGPVRIGFGFSNKEKQADPTIQHCAWGIGGVTGPGIYEKDDAVQSWWHGAGISDSGDPFFPWDFESAYKDNSFYTFVDPRKGQDPYPVKMRITIWVVSKAAKFNPELK